MSKDGYHVIAYKVLLYLYACLKEKISFDQRVYDKAIRKDQIGENYLINVYRMMQEKGLIEGAVFVKAWGNVLILASEEQDLRITVEGIEYLSEHGRMKAVRKYLLESMDMVAELIRMVGLE